MRASIIIPCKQIDEYTEECIRQCLKLDYPEFEIIVLPDHKPDHTIEGVRVIPTGEVTPGAKRNIGVVNSKGEVCAFIDSDAYPRRDWLKNAVKYLKDGDVVAVGGPGVTPETDGLMQKASGFVLSSFMVGGLSRRYKVTAGSVYDSDDVHSCNLVVRREALIKCGGWDEKYWPGEDTLLSLSLRRVGRVIEASDVVVFHHRKPLFKEHLKQISRFALHRGFFAKKYPGNSLKPTYFLPSLLILFLAFGGVISCFSPTFRVMYFSLLLAYLTLALVNASLARDVKLFFPVWIGTVLTHITYGTYFLIGLMKKELER
jgi:cellulose synthase/poly-beta-1,6-N-acetylglucosamine synthase-like glycosyltransferase